MTDEERQLVNDYLEIRRADENGIPYTSRHFLFEGSWLKKGSYGGNPTAERAMRKRIGPPPVNTSHSALSWRETLSDKEMNRLCKVQKQFEITNKTLEE